MEKSKKTIMYLILAIVLIVGIITLVLLLPKNGENSSGPNSSNGQGVGTEELSDKEKEYFQIVERYRSGQINVDERNELFKELDMGYEDFHDQNDAFNYFYGIKYEGKNGEIHDSYNPRGKESNSYAKVTPSSEEIFGDYESTITDASGNETTAIISLGDNGSELSYNDGKDTASLVYDRKSGRIFHELKNGDYFYDGKIEYESPADSDVIKFTLTKTNRFTGEVYTIVGRK